MSLTNPTSEELEKRREENKALGLHPMFWDTAFSLPEHPSEEIMDELFPSWRQVGREIKGQLLIDALVQEKAS